MVARRRPGVTRSNRARVKSNATLRFYSMDFSARRRADFRPADYQNVRVYFRESLE